MEELHTVAITESMKAFQLFRQMGSGLRINPMSLVNLRFKFDRFQMLTMDGGRFLRMVVLVPYGAQREKNCSTSRQEARSL